MLKTCIPAHLLHRNDAGGDFGKWWKDGFLFFWTGNGEGGEEGGGVSVLYTTQE